jgi:hypothetical protein
MEYSSTKNVRFIHGGFALKEQMERKGSGILFVRDEKEFYSLIEERMEDLGFEVFNTSPPLSRESDPIRLFNS